MYNPEDNQEPNAEQTEAFESQIMDCFIAEMAKKIDNPDSDNPISLDKPFTEQAVQLNLGKVVVTSQAMSELGDKVCKILSFCQMMTVWGNSLCDEDKQANEDAFKNGQRIVSSWELGANSYFIITEWDRSVTTILRKDEY
jgi:hypothetical protein